MNRVHGWSATLEALGDPDAGILPKLLIHKRCTHLIQCLPQLQHNPDSPSDILKTNITEDGTGGDDTADALRYMIATKPNVIVQRKLLGV